MQELERVVKELGFMRWRFRQCKRGKILMIPALALLGKVQELDVLVFVHPIGFTDRAAQGLLSQQCYRSALEEAVFV